jgi:hypothetical protein
MAEIPRQTIIDEFERSFKELIAAYAGQEPELIVGAAHDLGETTAAIVGFGDVYFSGSAVLFGSNMVAERLAESMPSNPSDWLGELSNQLVGRLKNKLTKYGVLPTVGMPVTVQGTNLNLSAVGSDPVVWRATWPGGIMQVLLALQTDDELELVPRFGCGAVAEGSMNLF